MAQTIQDTVQADGSVIRVITSISTQTFTAKQYQVMQIQLQSRITNDQTELATVTANVATSQTNVTKIKS